MTKDKGWLVDKLVEIHKEPVGDRTMLMQLLVLTYATDVEGYGLLWSLESLRKGPEGELHHSLLIPSSYLST